MENPFHYRNKVHVVFDRDKKKTRYPEYTKDVRIMSYRLNHARFRQEGRRNQSSIRRYAESFNIKNYDKDSGYGLLRHVLKGPAV